MKYKFLVVVALIMLSATSCRSQSVITDTVKKDSSRTEVIVIHDDVYWQPNPFWVYQGPVRNFYMRPHHRNFMRSNDRTNFARKQEGKKGAGQQHEMRSTMQYRQPQMRGNMQMRGNATPPMRGNMQQMHNNVQRPPQQQMRTAPPSRPANIRKDPGVDAYEMPMEDFIQFQNYKE